MSLKKYLSLRMEEYGEKGLSVILFEIAFLDAEHQFGNAALIRSV